MTTTLTLTTHDWPVAITTTDRVPNPDRTVKHLKSISVTTEIVPQNSERSIYITDTRSIDLRELPIPAEGEEGWNPKADA